MLKSKGVAVGLIVLALFMAGVLFGLPGGQTDQPKQTHRLSFFDPDKQVEFPEVDGSIKTIEPVSTSDIAKGATQSTATVIRKVKKLANPTMLLMILLGLAAWAYGYVNQRPINRGMIVVGICLFSLILLNYPAATKYILFRVLDNFINLVDSI